jgi:hypothetical protein
MTTEAQTERWRRLIASIAQARGHGGGPVTFLDDVMPVLSLTDSEQAEQHFVRGERLFSISNTSTGDATHYAVAVIYNPVGSGQLVVLEDMDLYSAATIASLQAFVALDLALGALGPAGVPAGRPMDTRNAVSSFAGSAGPVPIVNVTPQLANPGAGIPALQAILPANSQLNLLRTFRTVVLSPGYSFVLVDGLLGAGTVITWNMNGYTRTAEPTELTGL